MNMPYAIWMQNEIQMKECHVNEKYVQTKSSASKTSEDSILVMLVLDV